MNTRAISRRRRQLLQWGGLSVTGMASWLGLPGVAQAAADFDRAMSARKVEDVYEALGIKLPGTSSDAITLVAPEVAENGALVPVEYAVKAPGIEYVGLMGENNPFPLIAVYEQVNPQAGFMAGSVRIRLGETSNVRVIVKTTTGVLTRVVPVKVTVGGCLNA